MPVYEYFCPTCTSKYELLRPMSRSDEPGTCAKGHGGGARTIAAFAPVTRRAGGAEGGAYAGPSLGGGCACGGGGACGCGH